MKNNLIVVKHNDLILKAAYKLSLLELRILLFGIAKMNPLNKTMSEKRILDASEMAEIYHVPLNEFWRQISVASETLFRREIKLELSETVTRRSRWLYDIEIDSGKKTITFMFHPEVLERLHDFENNFTQYQLENIVQMGSAYSIRFYEWSISHLRASKKDTATYRKTVVELKETLDLGDKYKQLGDFKKRVLDAAQDEINKQTDVKFSYHIEKSGHAIKYIEFSARYNKRHKEDSETLPMLEPHQQPKALPEALPAHMQADNEPPQLDESLTPLPDDFSTANDSFSELKKEKEHHPFNYQSQQEDKPMHPVKKPSISLPEVRHDEIHDLYFYSKEGRKELEDKREKERNEKRGIELEYACDIATCNDPDALTRYIHGRLMMPNKALKACHPRPSASIKRTQRTIAEARARRTYLRKCT